MTHDEAFELLAPLALDALDADVQAAVEEHVLTCPRCRAELDGLRDVASAMGTTYESPPDGLWEKISARLYEREGSDVVPQLVFAGVDGSSESGPRRSALTRRVRALAITVSLAAAAAIIALGLSLSSANSQVNQLQNALSENGQSAVLTALSTPGHRVVTMKSAGDRQLAKFVLLPDGRGYLVSSKLPTLPSKETYQLWGFVNGTPISIGVMGSSPKQVAFTLASSPSPSALAVTIEPAGGSLRPASSLVASGTV
ncbi:MAG TPA: anti-sigma factor [Acidimicrobiales bacterium]|jgi:anti-sigma-K factor RskA|nr:anti-sigma factor [Acidimicrobiales bacterium]